MIDHYVSIGGEDVSADCYGIRITQTMTTDNDPGKATINLVNRRQKYTAHWTPQATEYYIIFYNYTYKNEPTEFFGIKGHITDVQCTAAEAIVTGECDMGHLADALGKEHSYDCEHEPPEGLTVEGVLKYILSTHTPAPIVVNYTAPERIIIEETFDAKTTYQEVVEKLANDVGAVFYFNDYNTLEFRDPRDITNYYNLDGYVINPEQTDSIMGFCNKVVVSGNASAANDNGPGAECPSGESFTAWAEDSQAYRDAKAARDFEDLWLDAVARYDYALEALGIDYDEVTGVDIGPDKQQYQDAYIKVHGGPGSIETVGVLMAPKYESHNLNSLAECQKKADELLQFYMMHKNALTKPIVAGMAPPLQSRVGYTPFVPIYGGEGSFGQVMGTVIEREIEYDADQGLLCTLTISPGLVASDAADITEYVEENYTHRQDLEEED